MKLCTGQLGVAAVISAALAGAAPAAEAPHGDVVIVLDAALRTPHTGAQVPIVIEATAGDEGWADAWAHAMTYNRAVHDVRIVESSADAEAVTLVVEADITGDFWVPAAQTRFTVSLTREADGPDADTSAHPALQTTAGRARFVGRFTGTCTVDGKSHDVAGTATAIVLPVEPPAEGFTPLAHDEWPRLLFRKHDLPRLRDRLATPLGRAIRARLEAMTDDAVAQGVLFQLTGDHAYARRALERTVYGINEPRRQDEHAEHHTAYLGNRLANAAYGYDLSRDAWTAEQRRPIERFLTSEGARAALHNPEQFGSKPITAPGKGLADQVYGGGALAALTLWGLEGPPPDKPAPVDDPALRRLQGRFGGGDDDGDGESAELRYQRELAAWELRGRAELAYLEAVDQARRIATVSAIYGIGEGGLGGHPNIWGFAEAYDRCFGRGITARPIFARAAAAAVVGACWPASDNDAPQRPWWHGEGDPPGGDHLARLLAHAPHDVRPVVAWHWLRAAGVSADDLATDRGARGFLERSGVTTAEGLTRLLAAWPTDPPRDPDGTVSKVWRSAADGTIIFRNGWLGADTVFAALDAPPPLDGRGASSESGGFIIHGLGYDWAVASDAIRRGERTRQAVNAVMLGDAAKVAAPAPVVSFTADADTGRGAVTADLSDLYRDAEVVTEQKIVTVREGRLTQQKPVTVERVEQRFPDASGWRAFAADFSGAGDTAAVFVIADRFNHSDGREARWVMHVPNLAPLPTSRKDRAAPRPFQPPDTVTDGNRFTITRGDATLHGTIVYPADATVELVTDRSVRVWLNRPLEKSSDWFDYPRRRIEAYDPTGEADGFIVVLTLQRGTPPTPRVDGDGFGAMIHVGDIAFWLKNDSVEFKEPR